MGITEAIDRLETKFTADIAGSADDLINASSSEFDQLTQYNWERLTYHLAEEIADFLYARDHDTLFLARAAAAADGEAGQRLIDDFRQASQGRITIPANYRFDEQTNHWVQASPKGTPAQIARADNAENANRFRYTIPAAIRKEQRPLYREITILDLNGNEIAKSSSINPARTNIADPGNTYLKAERYFPALESLAEGEIFVSEVIGRYTPTHMIGSYLKSRSDAANRPFEPHLSGYAGLENPVGQRYQGIVRFAAPIIRDGVKTGYITLALDHRHLMEFTDYIIPENSLGKDADPTGRIAFEGNIKDPSKGNYAFMWDEQGRSIAHPREYFMTGFDSETGERIPGWISADAAERFKSSGTEDLAAWLANQPHYRQQSRDKKPNIDQIKAGRIPLDCRYLDFAPQCTGWHQINQTGGYGSFLIYWSGIWKLTTAATIPYYTGQYGKSLRGFGFVTIGANVGEFTRSGIAAQEKLKGNIGALNQSISAEIRSIGSSTRNALAMFQDQMVLIGAVLLVAVLSFTTLASFSLRARIGELLRGTTELAKGQLDARIVTSGRDEISTIGVSFNTMAEALTRSRNELEEVNTNLEKMVAQRTEELRESNQQISDSIDYASRIQRSLLPNGETLKANLDDLAIIWQPKDVVGGDFYWHHRIGDRDFLVIMDCTGHGVPGAFMTMIATSVLDQITAATIASLASGDSAPSVSAIMQQLHDGVCHQLDQVGGATLSNDGLDAVILSIPRTGGELHFCGAAMDLFLRRDDGGVERIRGSKVSLGYQLKANSLDLAEHHLALDGATSFVVTTDGITTQIGETMKRSFGYRRFLETLAEAKDNSPKMINRALMRSFREWQGSEERRDDVTLISLKPAAR